MPSWELPKYIETKLKITYFYSISNKIFWKKKNFIVWLPLRCEILGNICIVIICKSGCDVINFETSIIFLIKLFILPDQKAKTKVKISWEWKELSRWIKKKIIIFKGLPLKQIKQFFWKVRVRLLKELYFIKVNMIVMGQRRAHETKHTQIFEK